MARVNGFVGPAYVARKGRAEFGQLVQQEMTSSDANVMRDPPRIRANQLLEFVTETQSLNEARLIITERIWPYAMYIGNMEVGGG
jgi:hypothetical protein